MSDKFLIAAARAHALVCIADGRLAWPEEHGFAGRMKSDPSFGSFSEQQLRQASVVAFAFLKGEEPFDAVAQQIASLVSTSDEREAVIRAARAALVADGARREQEDDAMVAIAKALGLDSSKA
ncbi:MAG: TerB family tellurite resistance protein [Alphaproteobacteria bacterium]|nr:TerB family tellurite resistance protein [Alphaproteobacteria bacterium]